MDPLTKLLAKHGTRALVWGLLALVVWLGLRQVIQWREDAATGAERIEARDRTAEAAGAIGQDLSKTTTDQQRVEVRISADTRQLAIDLETLRRENPDLDHWLAADIPGELRELAKRRREARDRLRADPAGSGTADP